MNFGNAAAVVRRSVAPTAEYFEPSWFQGAVIEYMYVCSYILRSVVSIVVHLWGRLSVVQVVRCSAFEIA